MNWQIKNWKQVKEQFGLDKAIKISSDLNRPERRQREDSAKRECVGEVVIVAIPESELDAMFEITDTAGSSNVWLVFTGTCG